MYCIPANSADVIPFSVTGNLSNAAFVTPIPDETTSYTPELAYGSKTILAAGIRYTVYAGAGYLIDDVGGGYGTTAGFSGVQVGAVPQGLNMPYFITASDMVSLGIIPAG